RESQIFTVEGDLWRIVTEDNDCDFHLELSAPGAGPTADRVIVEVPQDFTAARTSVLKQLAAHNLNFPASIMKQPIRLTVTGFAFYDAFHFSRSDLQRGHEHGTAFVGTLWERTRLGCSVAQRHPQSIAAPWCYGADSDLLQ